MMPEMNGYDVCKALKADAVTHNIPVIFVTALLNPGDETRGFEAGGVDYITKPVIGAVVRVRVKAHLALKEAQDAMEEWNHNLKRRLLQSIATIRTKTEALMSAEERAGGLRGYAQCVELLSGVFELMEDRFGVSSRAVSELAGDAARNMGLSAEEVAKVRLAALLHNVGTLGVRRSLSEKNESDMTANEQKAYIAHPVLGQELFKALEEFQDIALMVRSHHEAFNGSGFPDGLKGEDIPLGARLIAIADFIEHSANSVSSDRDDFALTNVRRHVGTLFDGRLVGHFTMITRILYFDKKKFGSTGEVEVSPNELMSGMMISRDLTNAAGMLLLQKGNRLDSSTIELIRRMNQPSNCGVWTYVSDEA
jgi:response regulator RpfG family c-di-GMP phosphodiesterase